MRPAARLFRQVNTIAAGNAPRAVQAQSHHGALADNFGLYTCQELYTQQTTNTYGGLGGRYKRVHAGANKRRSVADEM